MNDFLLDDDGDLKLSADDMVIGESTPQHQRLLLICNPGDWKEIPTACVGLRSWLKDDNPQAMLADIKSEFERDGMTVNSISMTNDNLNIDAHYTTTPDAT